MTNKSKNEKTLNGSKLYKAAFKALWDVTGGVKIQDVNGVELTVPKSPEDGDNAVFHFYKDVCDAEAMKIARSRKLPVGSRKFASVITEVDAKVNKAIRLFEKEFGHSPLRPGGYRAHAKRVKLQFWG